MYGVNVVSVKTIYVCSKCGKRVKPTGGKAPAKCPYGTCGGLVVMKVVVE